MTFFRHVVPIRHLLAGNGFGDSVLLNFTRPIVSRKFFRDFFPVCLVRRLQHSSLPSTRIFSEASLRDYTFLLCFFTLRRLFFLAPLLPPLYFLLFPVRFHPSELFVTNHRITNEAIIRADGADFAWTVLVFSRAEGQRRQHVFRRLHVALRRTLTRSLALSRASRALRGTLTAASLNFGASRGNFISGVF